MKCRYYPASLPVLSCSEGVCKSYFHILALEHRSHFQRQTVIWHYGQERIMLLWDKRTNCRRASCPWDQSDPWHDISFIRRKILIKTQIQTISEMLWLHELMDCQLLYTASGRCMCCAETCYSKSTKMSNIPTAAMAGALLKIYLVHTSLMVVASIACWCRKHYIRAVTINQSSTITTKLLFW